MTGSEPIPIQIIGSMHPYYVYTLYNLLVHSSYTFPLILLFIKSTVYCPAHFILLHILFKCFILYLIFFHTYIYVYSLVSVIMTSISSIEYSTAYTYSKELFTMHISAEYHSARLSCTFLWAQCLLMLLEGNTRQTLLNSAMQTVIHSTAQTTCI